MNRLGRVVNKAVVTAHRRTNFLFPTSRNYHLTHRADNQLIVGGIVLGITAMGLSRAIDAYNALPKEEPKETEEGSDKEEENSTENTKKKQAAESTEGGFASWFSFGKNFYDGGFEDKMTKREAALILGVRENTTPDRIKDAHRRILILNHPDRGGSSYLSAKVNEAKDMLMKGKN